MTDTNLGGVEGGGMKLSFHTLQSGRILPHAPWGSQLSARRRCHLNTDAASLQQINFISEGGKKRVVIGLMG